MDCTRMRRPLSALAAAALIGMVCFTAAAASTYYIDPSQVDLVHILAPPPAPDSNEGKADLAAVLAAQSARTDAEAMSAKADAEESVFRFGDVTGSEFRLKTCPSQQSSSRMCMQTTSKPLPWRNRISIDLVPSSPIKR